MLKNKQAIKALKKRQKEEINKAKLVVELRNREIKHQKKLAGIESGKWGGFLEWIWEIIPLLCVLAGISVLIWL